MRPSPRRAVQMLLLAGLYFATAKLGLMMDAVAGFAALVWPPTGIGLFALLVFGLRLWPAVALGAFLVNFSNDAPAWMAVSIAGGNTLEAVLAAYALGRIPGFQRSLERLRDVSALVVLAAGCSTMVSATIGVTSLYLGDVVSLARFGKTWTAWWLGDAIGNLIVAPAFLVWSIKGASVGKIGLKRTYEVLALAASIPALGYFLFKAPSALGEYCFFLPLIWAALRFGQKGVATTTFAVSSVATVITLLGHGPFVRSALSESLFSVQTFMAVTATAFLFLGAAISERSRLFADLEQNRKDLQRKVEERTAALEHSHALLSEAQEIGHIGTFRWDIEPNTVTWSDELYRIYGLEPRPHEGGWEAFLESVHREDRSRIEGAIHEAVSKRQSFEFDQRIVRPDGTVRILRSRGEVLFDDTAKTTRMIGVCQDITDQRRIEDDLRESQEELEERVQERTAELARATETLRASEWRKTAMLNASLDSIITIDHRGNVVEFNPAAETMFGYRREEVLDEEMADLIIPPRLREGHRRGLENYLATNEGRVLGKRIEFPALRANGQEFLCEIAIEAIHSAGPPLFTAYLRDITHRHLEQTRRAFMVEATSLLASSLDYEEALAAVGRLMVPRIADWCAVDLVDPSGAVRRVGMAHADPTNLQLSEKLQQSYPPSVEATHGVSQVLRTARPELVEDITEVAVSGTGDDEHVATLRRLGLRSAMVVPMCIDDEILGAITLVTMQSGRSLTASDLSLIQQLASNAAVAITKARLFADEQRARHGEQLAREDAEAAVQARDAFISIASHELRTPLSALALGLELLRGGGVSSDESPLQADRTLEMANKLARQVRRLTRLVDNLLDVSRITAGKLQLELEDVDLAAVARQAVSRFGEDLRRAKCPVQIEASVPISGLWDPMRLDQIASNLLSNAMKYGSGRPIEVRVEGDEEYGRLIVRDHGIGIAPADRDRIFERFERVVSARHAGGFGLGLWIVRQIVESLGGSIRVQSELGKGSMFRVELPRRQTARAEMRPTAVDSTVAGRLGNIDEMRERPVISSASAHSERVLIVEDNEDILESLSEILRMRGYTVARAFNGQEALEHLFHAKPPAVILLDLMMPVMDGEQFLDVKARIPGLAAIPVVLISAAGDLPGKAAELGVSDYLAKPIDAKRLLAIVERHCQRAPV